MENEQNVHRPIHRHIPPLYMRKFVRQNTPKLMLSQRNEQTRRNNDRRLVNTDYGRPRNALTCYKPHFTLYAH